MSDPEETAPFTHQPYGRDSEDNPFVSPSGPSAQPSGPGYTLPPSAPAPPPPPPPPPTVPYGAPSPGPYAAQPGWAPPYAGVYSAPQSHQGANTALTLGIISIVSLVLTPFCCITVLGLGCAPFAWIVGARAKRDIALRPGAYGNEGNAQTGMVMGIVVTLLSVLVIGGFIALFAWLGTTDYSLV